MPKFRDRFSIRGFYSNENVNNTLLGIKHTFEVFFEEDFPCGKGAAAGFLLFGAYKRPIVTKHIQAAVIERKGIGSIIKHSSPFHL